MKEFDVDKWYHKLDKLPAIVLRNKWNSYGGRIGCNSITLEYLEPVERGYPVAYYVRRTYHKKGMLGCGCREIPVPVEEVTFMDCGGQGWECYYRVKKTSTLNEHPNWRPLCIFHDYRQMHMDGRYYGTCDNGRVVLQSWEEIENIISEYGDQTLHIYRHPRQKD